MIWLSVLFIFLWMAACYRLSLIWTTVGLSVLLGVYGLLDIDNPALIPLATLFALIFVPFNLPFLRRQLISNVIFKWMKNALPKMSQTEREALEAGNTWWDAEIFSGTPDWPRLLDLPAPQLSKAEQDFIDGPVETLCAMLDDWDITHKRLDLPEQVWAFIKQHKFCGIIIPKKYGGLEYSNYAHSEIVMKISSRSSTAAVTVMVPNSLGPAKLLLAYGTEEQKNHYLPRLASGDEIPCFALTGPQAGSDASAMPDTGIVCYGDYNGQQKVLGIRLNWDKRYITLGPVATVLGLAFKLYDPNHLLGDHENIGITVALIPTHTKGITIGKRHFPLNSAFQNGPNQGKNVFIPIDWIIGGQAEAGNGWKMLMQSLATGRSISLPALATGAGKFTCRNTGAYARIRKQFNRAIGEFEGIQEPLARMAGQTYIIDAARKVTAAALDNGEKPSVISAIIKYELTERMRGIINDGMDIQGGSGICLGPHNYLGRLYQVIPVSITVEGANILTRTMMIFGQGAIRCHPYVQLEMESLQLADPQQALNQFDELLCKHISFIIHNVALSAWLGLSHAYFIKVPGTHYEKRYYRQISRLSVSFALLVDYALLTLGGSLKRRERISGRFADALSNLYLCSAVLKHFQDQGALENERPLMHWACRQTLYRAQQSLLALFYTLPFKPLASLFRVIMFPWGKPCRPPDDRLIEETAALLLDDSSVRDRLTHGIYINDNPDDPTGRIETAFKAVLAAAPVEIKIRQAQKQKLLEKGDIMQQIDAALTAGIISQEEGQLLHRAEKARQVAIKVDAFDPGELLS